jgi:hypothetical protein
MRTLRHRLRATSIAALLLLGSAVPATFAPAPAGADVTPELQKRINEAIDKGQDWLKAQQRADGSFQPLSIQGNPAYQVGVTALMGLALVAAGEPKKARPQKALAYVKETDLKRDGPSGARTTYATGVLIMFLTEMYRPDEKPEKEKDKEDARYATKPKKDPCKLPPDIAAWIQELALWLVDVQMQDGWWRYPHTPPSDLSNTQYALLGLRAARDCGAAVQQAPFLRAMTRTLEAQQKDGPPPADHPADEARRDGDAVGGDKALARLPGDRRHYVTGSMTTGDAVLAIAHDAMYEAEWFSATPEMERKVHAPCRTPARQELRWTNRPVARVAPLLPRPRARVRLCRPRQDRSFMVRMGPSTSRQQQKDGR